MAKITREELKTEAIRRMKKLKYFNLSIKEFEKNDAVMLNEPPLYAHFYLDEEQQKIVDDFEKDNDALVYAVIMSLTNFGKMYSLLFVGQYKEEWEYFDEDLKDGITFAYVHNCDMPDCSEFGSIGIKLSPAAGLMRTA